MTYKIPGSPVFAACTDSSAEMIKLLGAKVAYNGVHYTHDEANNLYRFYGLDKQKIKNDVDEIINKAQARLDEVTEAWNAGIPRWNGRVDATGKELVNPETIKLPVRSESENFLMSGSSLNIMRHAEKDGLRIIGAISKFLEPGEDPVRTVLLAMSEAGYDVTEGDWLWNDPEEESYNRSPEEFWD